MAAKRLSRDETRNAVIDAGLRLLAERGPSIGLDRVSFAHAIEAADVPRPSAYRAFGDSRAREPQDHFRHQLALEVVRANWRSENDPLDTVLEPIYQLAYDDSQTDESLSALLHQAIRLSGDAYLSALTSQPLTPIYVTIMLAAGDDEEISEAARSAELNAIGHYIAAYKQLAANFGLRLRDGWTWESFAAMVTRSWAGGYLLQSVYASQGPVMRPTGEDGELEPWNHLSLVVEGAVLVALEPNPRMKVAARPHLWVEPAK